LGSAGRLSESLCSSPQPSPGLHEFAFVHSGRAHAVRSRLERLAERFRDPAEQVSPRSAALCRLLLCEPPVSPLYNPALPPAQLERALDLIAAGFDEPARHLSS
jgi:hypothetical protein